MIKFCQKFKTYFSSSFIPYNPKGFKDVSKYIQNHQSIQIKLCDFDVSKDQFIYAYNNFLNSIQDDDFNLYVQEVCDKQLADQFIEGLSRIQNQSLKLEKVLNDEVQEEIFFTEFNFFISVNRNISLYDHTVLQSLDEFPKFIQLNSQAKELLNCVQIGAFIKSKLSLKISDFEHEPENFHHVRFMVLKDAEELKSLFSTLKSILFYNEKEVYFGNNPTWKIIDLDRNMGKQYPLFF
ncbi:unnamed protein product [Paramecium sonneborni]|uniref:Uncharacterized protein n=1 Tax=Paramecium sonneborni TaxID=65129 RepID=A0A8S1QV57_9CILI|nr:unnamed protein product [Paramecium sonneborni]